MMISTRGRYALRVLTDMAEHGGDGYLPLKEIAARQEISLKYLESIMSVLSHAGMVDSVQGKGGGYRLNRPLDQYRLGDILRETEGSLVPVACLEAGSKPCSRVASCRTLPIWEGLDRVLSEYLSGYTVQDLICPEAETGDGE